MASERGVAIDIDRVTEAFPIDGKRATQALTEISLSIRPGEFVSVVGPSGCGKSTLMLMTAGLLGPTTGSIRVAGQALAAPLTDVGIVFQDDLLLEFRKALDNVLLQGRIRRLDCARCEPARSSCWSSWAWPTPPIGIRGSCRAACGSGCRLRARWSTVRPCS